MLKLGQLCIVENPLDRFVLNRPVDTVRAAPTMNVHLAFFIVAAKYTCEAILERHHRTVEDTVR